MLREGSQYTNVPPEHDREFAARVWFGAACALMGGLVGAFLVWIF